MGSNVNSNTENKSFHNPGSYSQPLGSQQKQKKKMYCTSK